MTAALGGATLASAATGQPSGGDHAGGIKHVLLISVDGMHQQDLAWYVQTYPHSALAALERKGVEYGNAQTPFPSDSSPGMVAQVTGGDPQATGIYYDDTWNHNVFPAGTTSCSGPVPGGEAPYHEGIDKDPTRLDAGQGLAGLPGSILRMTSNPTEVLDPAKMPVNPTTCKPIYPNQYIQVNTIFKARVPDAPIISAINAAWTATHPTAGNLVIFSTDDDGMLLWLSDRSQAAAGFVKNYLLTHSAAGNNISGNPITVSASGLKTVYAGAASAAFYGVSVSDPRHPDVTGLAQHGVVYTGGKAKIAEHGGDDRQDRNVPILVVLPGVRDGRTLSTAVETTQIAPTILRLLGLNPDELQAVQIEHTRVLPGVEGDTGH